MMTDRSAGPAAEYDLEIHIRKQEEAGFPVSMTATGPDGPRELGPGYLDPEAVERLRPWESEARRCRVLLSDLCRDDTLRSAWAEVRGASPGRRLRLRLDPDAPELHTLFWEALCEGRDGELPVVLAANAETPFSRYLDGPLPPGEAVTERPVRLLVAIANPENLGEYDLPLIDVEAEVASLSRAVGDSVTAGEVTLIPFRGPVTLQSLGQALDEHRPHFLHLMAHGRFNESTDGEPDASILYLEDEEGRVAMANVEALTGMLRRAGEPPRLLFLASCEGARRDTGNAFRGFAPRLVRDAGVPAVVAMQGTILIDAARPFVATFYRRLLAHGRVDRATNEARSQLLNAGLPGAVYPVLFLRLRDGVLLRREEAFPGARLATFRAHLGEKLSDFQHRHVALEAQEIVFSGSEVQPVPDTRRPLLEQVRLHPRLVLLGTAGSGKSTSLRQIAGACLGEASELGGRLPLHIELRRLAPSPGTAADEALLALLAEALYQGRAADAPPTAAAVRTLLDGGPPLLLLFDGLNELPEPMARTGRQAIEDLASRFDRHTCVVTSRPHGFQPLEGWVTCELLPLDEVRMHDLLARVTNGEEADALLATALGAENSLLRLPLFLGFVARERSKLARLGKGLGSSSRLLRWYVDQLLAREGGQQPEATLREALCVLAEIARGRLALPVREVRSRLREHPDLAADEGVAAAIVEELCRRDLLVERNGDLSFWHQTLQEYFAAGAFVRRWRGEAPVIPRRPPRPIREALGAAANQEVLAFAVAHLASEELTPAFAATMAENPVLATLWADDLSLEERAPEVTGRCLADLGHLARRACLWAWLGDTKRVGPVGVVLFGAGMLVATFAFLGSLVALPYGLVEGEPVTALLGGLGLTGIPLGIVALYRTLHRPWASQLVGLLGQIRHLRSPVLRGRLQAVAEEVERFWLAPGRLKAAADLGLHLHNLEPGALVDALEESGGRKEILTGLATLESPHVAPLLAELIAYRNYLTTPALAAMAERCQRFPRERESLAAAVERGWAILEGSPDAPVAEALLRSLNAPVPRRSLWRRLAPLGTAFGYLAFNVFGRGLENLGDRAVPGTGWGAFGYALLALLFAVGVGSRMGAKGARRVLLRQPRVEISSPWQLTAVFLAVSALLGVPLLLAGMTELALLSLLGLALLLPVLCNRALHTSEPVDWNTLRATLRTGTSL